MSGPQSIADIEAGELARTSAQATTADHEARMWIAALLSEVGGALLDRGATRREILQAVKAVGVRGGR